MLKVESNEITIKELKKFIDVEHQRMVKRWRENRKIRTMARTIKLMEELGELCNEIMAYNVKQRKKKMHLQDTKKLEDEFADVIIVTLLLAKNVKIDIYQAINNKIKKIERRWRALQY